MNDFFIIHNFFIIHPRKKMQDENDIEFDFSIGHALVIFPFLRIINKTMSGEPSTPPPTPEINIYQYILFLTHYFHPI